eukprot:4334068-Pyramimonas_sp.AAC.1
MPTYPGQQFGEWAMAAGHCLATLCDTAPRSTARWGQPVRCIWVSAASLAKQGRDSREGAGRPEVNMWGTLADRVTERMRIAARSGILPRL